MTTDQNARETAARVLRKNFPALGWVTSLADEVVDAYLAAVTAPEEVAGVVEDDETNVELLRAEAATVGVGSDCIAVAELLERNAILILALHAGKAAEREQRITAERERDEFQRLWFDGEGYLSAAKARATSAKSALATMTAERDRLREALEKARDQMTGDYVDEVWGRDLTYIARALTGGGDGK